MATRSTSTAQMARRRRQRAASGVQAAAVVALAIIVVVADAGGVGLAAEAEAAGTSKHSKAALQSAAFFLSGWFRGLLTLQITTFCEPLRTHQSFV